jgi:deoxyribodipyrimidine photo-lyase
MSANVGNWQWAAGTGCDAAPILEYLTRNSTKEI